MRHYEIVILVHPDQSAQVEGMMGRYKALVEKGNGVIHRSEDWGRRQLTYTINKVRKAHYFLMNIECDQATLDELNNSFKFNDAILRDLVLARKKAMVDPSPFMKEVERKSRYKAEKADRSRHAQPKKPVTETAPSEVVTASSDAGAESSPEE